MRKILIIDDDRYIIDTLSKKIHETNAKVEILTAQSYKEAVSLVRTHQDDIAVAIIDLHLPGAKDGAAIQLTNATDIPSIVFTALEDDEFKVRSLEKHVLEYVLKGDFSTLDYVAAMSVRILKNYDTHILLVDDSAMSLNLLELTLEKFHFNIHKAKDGQEALERIEAGDVEFSIVLTDYQMPRMDGLMLTQKIRKNIRKDRLAIIALSGDENGGAVSAFLKVGANDFIKKPFEPQELFIRINNNLELLDMFALAKQVASQDFLTGAFNRRYFTDAARAMLARAQRNEQNVAIAMLDIDHFKKINDTYGHDMGDVALKECVALLNRLMRKSDLMARMGGEEFALLFDDISKEDFVKRLEVIRAEFEALSIEFAGDTIRFTVSIGAYYGPVFELDELLKYADEALYVSKGSGRNRVSFYEL